MSNDPIVDELHRQRAEEMASFNYDFEAFFRALKEEEKHSSRPIQPPPASGSGESRSRFARR